MEAIDQKDEERFKKWIDITERAILKAAESL
jgi:N-acetylated-alpha-linked acidic dipeptidase